MLFFIKKIHKNIPSNIREFYMPLVEKILYGIQWCMNFLYPSVTIFEGFEKNSKFPLTFAYIGSAFHKENAYDPQLEQYWSQICLCDGYRRQDMGRHFIWDILVFLKNLPFKCDFFLIEEDLLSSRCFHTVPGFKTPHWINLEIDITPPIEELFGTQRREIPRKIRKNNLSYLMANDKKSFDDFYYNMFLPYISTKHAATADITSYQEMFRIFSRGGLILIKKGDEAVAGGLLEFVGQQVRARRLGVREGKMEYVQDGVLGALYYFPAVEMKKKGFTSLLTGGARPHFSNGVFKHKLLLGAQMVKEKRLPCLYLGLLNNSVSVKHLLTNNSFIFIDKEKNFYRAIFGEIIEGKLPQESEALLQLSCGGLKGTVFFAFNELNNPPVENLPGEHPYVLKFFKDMLIKQ